MCTLTLFCMMLSSTMVGLYLLPSYFCAVSLFRCKWPLLNLHWPLLNPCAISSFSAILWLTQLKAICVSNQILLQLIIYLILNVLYFKDIPRLEGADALVFVYAIDEHRSFVYIQDILQEVRRQDNHSGAVIMVANKSDLVRSRDVQEHGMTGISILASHVIQLCSGITRGKVLNGELYAARLHAHVNLSAFVYRLFHEDFSPIIQSRFVLTIGEKSSWNSL